MLTGHWRRYLRNSHSWVNQYLLIMSMINKVFFSTMWDLYFLWKYEWKELITPNSFEEIVKSHLSISMIAKA